MKKFIILFSILMAPIFAKEDRPLPELERVITKSDLDAQLMSELIAGMHPTIALECKEGNAHPVQFLCKMGIFSAKWDPNLLLRVEKPFYLRFIRGKVYMSFDLVQWDKAKRFFQGNFISHFQLDPQSTLQIEAELVPYSDSEYENEDESDDDYFE